jgi:hypothetical protein
MTREPFSPETRLCKENFDELERDGRVSLNEEQRQQIEKALQRYERQRRARPVTHELAAALARSLETAIGFIDTMQRDHPLLWNHLANTEIRLSESDLTHFRAFKGRCKKYGAAHRGRPRDIFLPQLLTTLAGIFGTAGGEARILHGTKEKRRGPFLDFIFSATRHLPADLRRSKDALGNQWQEICAAREKGDFDEIHMSDSKLFDIVVARRPIERRKKG